MTVGIAAPAHSPESKHSMITSAFLQASSRLALSSGLEEVSTKTMGTPSGVVSCASLVGGSTGGGCSGKDSVAADVIREDFPTPASPTTTILTGLAGLMSWETLQMSAIVRALCRSLDPSILLRLVI